MTDRSVVRHASQQSRGAAAGRRRGSRMSVLAGLAIAAGAGAGALGVAQTTSAGFTDQANLNLGTGTDDSGIGFPYRFDIGVVLPDGTVEQADGPQGFDWVVEGADTLVPGHEITTTIPVFNNTPTLNADTSVEIVLRNGDGQVGPGIPNITELLRFTAVDSDGDVLFSDVAWSDANASLGVLVARDADALAQGDAYAAGPVGSAEEITLTIAYPDGPGVEAYNGGQSAFSARFVATSVKP